MLNESDRETGLDLNVTGELSHNDKEKAFVFEGKELIVKVVFEFSKLVYNLDMSFNGEDQVQNLVEQYKSKTVEFKTVLNNFYDFKECSKCTSHYLQCFEVLLHHLFYSFICFKFVMSYHDHVHLGLPL